MVRRRHASRSSVAGGRLLLDPNTFSADGTSSLAGVDASRDGRLLAYRSATAAATGRRCASRTSRPARTSTTSLTKVKFSEATWLPDGSFLYLHFPTEGEGRGTEAAALPAGRLRRHVLGTPQDDDAVVWECRSSPQVIPEPSCPTTAAGSRCTCTTAPRRRTGSGSTRSAPRTAPAARRAGAARRRGHADVPLRARRRPRTCCCTPTTRRRCAGWCASTSTPYADRPDRATSSPSPDVALERSSAAGAAGRRAPRRRPRGHPLVPRGEDVGDRDVAGARCSRAAARSAATRCSSAWSSLTSRVRRTACDLAAGHLTVVDGARAWRRAVVAAAGRSGRASPGAEQGRHRGPLLPRPPCRRRPRRSRDRRCSTATAASTSRCSPTSGPCSPAGSSAGGVLAIANLRGGSEYGAAWHDAGRLHAQAERVRRLRRGGDHLVEQGVTTREPARDPRPQQRRSARRARPCCSGPTSPPWRCRRSACWTCCASTSSPSARPGCPTTARPTTRRCSRRCSPTRPCTTSSKGATYPATLVMTGDHDDRVVPAHSFKFTAELQRAQGGDAPVLARIETVAGHGAGHGRRRGRGRGRRPAGVRRRAHRPGRRGTRSTA